MKIKKLFYSTSDENDFFKVMEESETAANNSDEVEVLNYLQDICKQL